MRTIMSGRKADGEPKCPARRRHANKTGQHIQIADPTLVFTDLDSRLHQPDIIHKISETLEIFIVKNHGISLRYPKRCLGINAKADAEAD